MSICLKRCMSDDDYKKVSLFLLKYRRDLHPSCTAIDIVTAIYSYLTEGNLIYIEDQSGELIGVAAYYFGTQEYEYRNKEVAFVDNAILAPNNRRTGAFSKGIQLLIIEIIKDNPEVQEFQFVALSENEYLRKLYSKFASVSFSRESNRGMEDVYSVKIYQLKGLLGRFGNL